MTKYIKNTNGVIYLLDKFGKGNLPIRILLLNDKSIVSRVIKDNLKDLINTLRCRMTDKMT